MFLNFAKRANVVSSIDSQDLSLTFEEASDLCNKGYFVTHRSFDSSQSMHAWHNCLYYEDGANLSNSGFVDNLPEFLEKGWSVKYKPENIDSIKLDAMHLESDGYMLTISSYEDCANV